MILSHKVFKWFGHLGRVNRELLTKRLNNSVVEEHEIEPGPTQIGWKN